MPTTLRAYLTGPNASLTVHPSANCSAARNDAASWRWPVVDEWRVWTDFNIENINVLFGALLDTTFELADPPRPLKSACLLRHEDQFEFVLTRHNNFVVNEALRVACDHLSVGSVEWTRGGNDTGERMFPDWSGTAVSEFDHGANLVPRDSKFTRNLLRAQREETADVLDSDQLAVPSSPTSETNLARSCLQQVDNYATARRVRYFYVITNRELFLCRRTIDRPLDTSIAAQRTKRAKVSRPYSTPERRRAITASSPPATVLRSKRPPVDLGDATATLPSSPFTSPATPSLPDLYSDSTYLGDDVDDDTGNLECVSIPWDKEERLTINLGLFVILLLARISNEIRTEYKAIHVDPEYCEKLKG